VRGQKINKASRTLDIVLVAARYKQNGTLKFAKGYKRRGVVWSDLNIFDREMLMNMVRAGKQIFTGNPVKLPGNYEPINRVRVEERNGAARLVANGSSSSEDDLGLPVL
jgi:hypothetical protein